MKNCVVLLLTLGLTVGAAEADFKVFDGALYDVFFTNPVAVGDGSEDLLSVVLRVENKTGDCGFDACAFTGAPWSGQPDITGITGKLHQHYCTLPPFGSSSPAPSPSPTLDTFVFWDGEYPVELISGTYATAIDTHFLFVLADLLIVVAPSEDATMPSAEASDADPTFLAFAETHFGTFLTGIFAVDPVPTWDLAQIVVPFGETVTLFFFLSGTAGGEIIDTSFPVPGPATLGLVAMGGLALLRGKSKIPSGRGFRRR